VRQLWPRDLEAMIALDAKGSGHRRGEHYKRKLNEALPNSGVQLSLGAELDDILPGVLLARVSGEFGTLEPVAGLDTMGSTSPFKSAASGRPSSTISGRISSASASGGSSRSWPGGIPRRSGVL
jgi:hypothetical protein